MCMAWNLIWCAIQNICSSCHIITIVVVFVGVAVATAALAYCFHHHHHHYDVCSALYTNDTKIHSDFCEYAKICVVWHFPTITDNAQPEDVEATWSPWHYIWYSICVDRYIVIYSMLFRQFIASVEQILQENKIFTISAGNLSICRKDFIVKEFKLLRLYACIVIFAISSVNFKILKQKH